MSSRRAQMELSVAPPPREAATEGEVGAAAVGAARAAGAARALRAAAGAAGAARAAGAVRAAAGAAGAARVAPPDEAAMAEAVRGFLVGCGLDLSHPDLSATAGRVARTWCAEFLAGYAMDPGRILGEVVEGEPDPDGVMLTGLTFHAMCPHHLFPYRGKAHVLYIPDGRLVGFGRIAELVDCFTRRLTLQERATHQIAEALVRHLHARGAGCVLEAEQACLIVPSEKHAGSRVVTSAFLGEVRGREDLRGRLMAAAGA